MIHIPRFPAPFMWRYRLHLPRGRSWMLYTGVGLLAIAATAAATLAFSKPASAVDAATIQNVVLSFANTWDPKADPLVKVKDGVMAKRSNVEGVMVGDVRYYYRTINSFSFDPVSLDKAKRYEIVSVVDEGTDWETIVYRLLD